jgi:hypothetical protein
MCRRG